MSIAYDGFGPMDAHSEIKSLRSQLEVLQAAYAARFARASERAERAAKTAEHLAQELVRHQRVLGAERDLRRQQELAIRDAAILPWWRWRQRRRLMRAAAGYSGE